MMKNNKTLSLEKYLQEISREPLLSQDEETELAKKIHKGDREALERLVRGNLRFVVCVAKQYQDQGLSLPDLINEGNVGLMKAAEKFDETRGFKFITYAVWWVRESILRALAAELSSEGVPAGSLTERERSIQQSINEGKSLADIAKEWGLTEERVRQILAKAQRKQNRL
ncbi:MAG: sigma-70 family RNA polymerase sigma factor [Bacteroidaceae bacterium]|nr:sigma-70 family RNA polymerase sigma factor [Bacteroidaceae bacterium]